MGAVLQKAVLQKAPLLRSHLPSKFLIQEQLRRRIVKRFRGGLVCKAHRLLFHSTLGSRVIHKIKKDAAAPGVLQEAPLFPQVTTDER